MCSDKLETLNAASSNNDFLGYQLSEKGCSFRYFCPKAEQVTLEIFEKYRDKRGKQYKMNKLDDGVWEIFIPEQLTGKYYGYRPSPSVQSKKLNIPAGQLIADPYSKLVTTTNHYLQYPKTKISNHNFDWGDDSFQAPSDNRDLIIYETHIKDMVAHPSAETRVEGIYMDFINAKTGGLAHLKKLGVNAVEFLPLQKYGYFEPPFKQKTETGFKNTWNPYSKNYWGYMTSFFFAPATEWCSKGNLEPGAVNGETEHALTEFKSLIKTLHSQGFTVLMDVVYNHLSQYDLNPLKQTDPDYYLRKDEHGNFKNDSWTGNDFRTESEYGRKIIVDSICYWMSEYHIDGFRFDLAGLFDPETIDQIREEAQKINPNVILIAEPWGGDYKPDRYSDHGWGSWNDRIRNAIKGYNPQSDFGFIFGKWSNGMTRHALENFIRGTLKQGDHGLFNSPAHSVNYVESHDGHTLGDYIRIALDHAKAKNKYKNSSEATKLTPKELAAAKLAALFLFVSQGALMIHAGQEWARAKVIAKTAVPDKNTGMLDHDSYNKDNETNYLNFNDIRLNQELFDYYTGLIKLRKEFAAFRKAEPEQVNFKVYNDPLHITFQLHAPQTGDHNEYFISLNGNPDKNHDIDLPDGEWQIIVNGQKAGVQAIDEVNKSYTIPKTTGIIFRKLRS